MTVYNVSSGVTSKNLTLKSGDSITVSAGGTVLTEVNSGGSESVYGTVSGLAINSGGTDYLYSGGIESSVVINSAGSQTVYAGGAETGVKINSGGYELNYAGNVNSVTINSGGTFNDRGGIASAVSVASGGVLAVNGATSVINGLTVSSGGLVTGTLDITSGTVINQGSTDVANAYNLHAGAMINTLEVVSGASISGFNDVFQGSLILDSGAVASATTLNSGVTEYVSGTVTGLIVNSGATDYLYSGGVETNVVVNSGGGQYIYNGGTLTGAVINSGGSDVMYGGSVSGVSIQSGGTFNDRGGVATAITVSSGGILDVNGSSSPVSGLTVSSGGMVSGTLVIASGTVVNQGGTDVANADNLHSGAMIQGIELLSGATLSGFNELFQGTLTIDHGATLSAGAIGSGSNEYTSGMVSGLAVNSGGTDYLYSGGVESNVTVNSGGSQYLYSGGSLTGVIVGSGGNDVMYGGSVSGVSILSGGTFNDRSGVAAAITVSSGGILDVNGSSSLISGLTVSSGGMVNGTLAIASGTVINTAAANVANADNLHSGATIQGIELLSGATLSAFNNSLHTTLTIDKGATLTAGILGSGGTDYTYGTVSGLTTGNGGVDYIFSGGVENKAVINSGGNEYIYNGGAVSGATIQGGGNALMYAGGTASGVVILSGGTFNDRGGVATAITVSSGGTLDVNGSSSVISGLIVSSGGMVSGTLAIASGTVINEGATNVAKAFNLHSGALIQAVEVLSGAAVSGFNDIFHATLTIDNGATATAGVLISGISEYTYGTANGLTISNGGIDYLYSGGVESKVVVNSGGSQNVYNGGVLNGLTVNSGGNDYFYGGAASGVVMQNGGTFYDRGGVATAVTVQSGGILNVNGNSVISGLIVNSGGIVSGTLDIVSGSVVNQGAANVANAFNLHSGALIQAVEVVSGAALSGFSDVFNAALTIDKGASATADVLNSGSVEYTYGTVNADTVNAGALDYLYSGGVESGGAVNSGGSQYIYAGGTVSGVAVNAGGNEILYGGNIVSATVNAGGVLSAGSAATVTALVVNSGGVADINGATLGGVVVNSGGDLWLNEHNPAGITVNGGAMLDLAGITATSASVIAGNQLQVKNGNTVVDTIGLNGNTGNYVFTTKSDGAGGTDIVISSLTSVTAVNYDAGSGKLVFTGSHLTTAAADYLVSAFTLTGDGNHSYALTGGSVVSGTPAATSVAIQLSTADQLAVNGLLNQNGLAAYDATAYSIGAPGGWDQGANALAAMPVTVANAGAPVISGVSYDAVSGILTVSGSHFSNYGVASGIAAGDFSFSGGNGSYTLTAGSDSVGNLTSSSFTISLNAADQAKVNAFVDRNGLAPDTGTAYNLAASAGWDGDSSAAIATQAVSVGGLTPSITSVGYNAATGQLTLGGHYFSNAAGFTVGDLTLTGDGGAGASYTLTAGSAISGATTATSAVIQLSAADMLAVNGLLNKNGLAANDATTYNLSAAPGWEAAANAIATQSVKVAGQVAPTLKTVAYDAASGVFTFTGSNLSNHGAAIGIVATDFKFTGGVGSYSFTAADTVGNVSASGFTITLDPNDVPKVNAFANANGTVPASGAAYNLAVAANWDSDGGAAIATKAVTVGNVAQAPHITSAAYNAATGKLTLNGGNLTAAGFTVTDFSLKGDGGASYTLGAGSSVSGVPTATQAVIQLSAADMLAVNGLLNANGAKANDKTTTYNLSATAGWDTGAGAATSAMTVSGVTAPAISAVSYDAATGVFTVTGSNFTNHGSANGIAVANFTFSDGGGSYTLAAGSDTVSNLTATGFTLTLNPADQTKVNAFVNANGGSTLNGSAYNLAVTGNWDSDNGAAIATQAVSVNGVQPVQLTAASVTLPAAVAADAKGDLYLLDLHGVEEIAAGAAAPTNLLGLSSLGLGLFGTPLAVDTGGDLFLGVQQTTVNGSWVNYGIAELTAGSHALQLVASLAAQPLAVGVDQAGDVYAALANNSLVEVVAGSHSATVLAAATPLNGPLGLVVDGAGNLYVGQSDGSIVELAAGGKALTTLVAAGAAPAYAGGSLGVDKAGDVYYLSGSAGQGWSVAEIAAGTHAVATLDSLSVGAGFLPRGVSADAAGNVYVPDFVNNSIQEIVNPNPAQVALVGLAHHG